MAMYEPLRDAFRELNRMLIDKQQFDAQHEANMAKSALESKLLDADLQDRALKRKVLQMNAEEAEYRTTPREFSIYPMINNDKALMDEPGFADETAMIFGSDVKIDPGTGYPVGHDGRTIKLTPLQIETYVLPTILGIASRHENKPRRAQLNIYAIQKKIKDTKTEISKLKKRGPRFVTQLGQAQAKLKQYNQDLEAQQSFFEPESLNEYYLEKMDDMENLQRYAVSLRSDRLATYAQNALAEFGKEHREVMSRLWATKTTGLTGLTSVPIYATKNITFGGRKFKAGDQVTRFVFDKASGKYGFRGEIFDTMPEGLTETAPGAYKGFMEIPKSFIDTTITPKDEITPLTGDQNAARKLAYGLIAKWGAEHEPVNEAEANAMGKSALDEVRRVHNMYYTEYKEMYDAYKTKQITEQRWQEWFDRYVETTMNAMDYVPVEPFAVQIIRAGYID